MSEIRIDRFGNLVQLPAFLAVVRRRERSWRRLGLSALAVVGSLLVLGVVGLALVIGAETLIDTHGRDFPGAFAARMNDPFASDPTLADDTRFVAQIGLGFGLAMAGALFLLSRINDRPMLTWITAAPRFRWRLLAGGGLVFGAIAAAAMGIGYFVFPQDYGFPLFEPDEFLWVRIAYLVAMLVFILPQAAMEEFVARGWVMQTTAAFSNHIVAILAVNGLLFALLQVDPDPLANIAYLASALVWSWAALRFGGLEFAIGGHAASSLLGGLLMTPMNEAIGERAAVQLGLDLAATLALLVAIEVIARSPGLKSLIGAGLPAREATASA